jgi:Methylase involved in ubiquinone/menaquinone biosynthesis
MASRDPKEVDVASRLISDRIAEIYDEQLKLHARGLLLDLGCGKVPLYETYKPYITDCVCVDWANTLHKNDHLDLEADLTIALPLGNGEFDTILLSDVLEHIPEPECFCREMARVLAPGGKLIMNVPFYYWLHEQPYDFYRYTEFALRRFMERCGMAVLQLQAIGGVPEILADLFAKNIRRIPGIGPAAAALSQSVTEAITHTSIGHKISAATGRRFPLGYFMVAVKPS